MVGGSQLTQLKSALSDAGIARQSAGKKRKRGSAKDTEKDKKAQLQEIQQKLNPFLLKITKVKHDIGGRKLKGVIGKPVISNQAGIEQREKTLLQEFKTKDHTGGVVDRRFGENDPTLSIEERMLGRFTKERRRFSKAASFNLNDDEELTHFGQSLSKFDDFDNTGLSLVEEGEESDGKIYESTVRGIHFGGLNEEDEESEESSPRKKSKAEVMAEVIAKSKEHKYQRQMERQQDNNVRIELDEDYQNIRALLMQDAGIWPSETRTTSGEDSSAPTRNSETRSEEIMYDQHVRELALDRRAKPRDRTKTEEELALEAKEALEKAEKKRLRRMLGDDSDSGSDDTAPKRRNRRGGDDLEDDFRDDTPITFIGGGLETSNRKADVGDDDDDSGDSSDNSGSYELKDSLHRPNGKVPTEKSDSQAKELPFTFPCPETHDELLEIVASVSDKEIPVVLNRIRTLHHPSLAEVNKLKLQNLTESLIDYILHLASPPNPNYLLIKSIMPQVHILCQAYPTTSARHFVDKLKLMLKNLTLGLTKGAALAASKTWPGTAELTFLHTVSTLWPTSDMNHYVVNPARLLMASYLGLGKIRGYQDLASGLYLCTLVLQFERLSRRFFPESTAFLYKALIYLAPCKIETIEYLSHTLVCPTLDTELLRHFQSHGELDISETQKLNLSELLRSEQNIYHNRSSLLATCLKLITRFAEMYKSLDGFIEIFDPLSRALEGIVETKLSPALQMLLGESSSSLQHLLKFTSQSRRPLMLQAHKPMPIQSYVPKFETSSSSYLRRNDPDHERSAMVKLQRQLKEERKGAMKELRKDARFLANVRQEEQQEKDKNYRDHMNKAFNSLESERAEQRKIERQTKKERKRAKK